MTFADIGAFFGGLIASLVNYIRGEPAPEPAATKSPDGMTRNEEAARKQAEADAAAAKVRK